MSVDSHTHIEEENCRNRNKAYRGREGTLQGLHLLAIRLSDLGETFPISRVQAACIVEGLGRDGRVKRHWMDAALAFELLQASEQSNCKIKLVKRGKRFEEHLAGSVE